MPTPLPPLRDLKVAFWYVSVMLGVTARSIFSSNMAGHGLELSPNHFIVSSIVAAVIFPLLLEKIQKFDASMPNLAQFFIFFSAGFFTETLIGGLPA